MNDSQTDSIFTAESNDPVIDSPWADVRILHESERGWCSVYTCLHNGRRIVLKTLKDRYRDSKLHQRLLRKEYAVGSMMAHHGIVSMLGFECVPGIGDSILMEYVDGMPLDEYLATYPKLNWSERLNIVNQICAAVSYIHSHQMVHCDIKPSNILVTRDGAFVKIIDFGLCRGISFNLLDLPGGTHGFTAPENMQTDSKASPATDIYSIGKILELMDCKARMKGVWRKCISDSAANRPKSANEIVERIRRTHIHRKIGKLTAAIFGTAMIAGGLFSLWQYLHPVTADTRPSVMEVPSDNTPPSPAPPEENTESVVAEPFIADKSDRLTPTEKKWSEVKDSESISSEEVSPRPIVDAESPEFRERLSEQFRQVVGRRFKEHLTLIDTMTTSRSNLLQLAGHWRWLAKQDIRKWLEAELHPDYPKVEEIMKDIDRYVKEYGEFSFRRDLEGTHRQEAAKRNPDMIGGSTKYAYYNALNELVVRKFGEDGEWHEEIIKVPVNRLDPMETMKIKDEYMKKALED